jgi:putative two-component system response regulator
MMSNGRNGLFAMVSKAGRQEAHERAQTPGMAWDRFLTDGHGERVEAYLRLLADACEDLGAKGGQALSMGGDAFFEAARLHDIGKAAVRGAILRKAGPLTPAEFEEMKLHTLHGERLIARMQRGQAAARQLSGKPRAGGKAAMMLEHARQMAASHHEKWDGSGYPRRLRGEDIPLQGRMLAIADVYDALVSDRAYKEGFSHWDAVSIMRYESPGHFDPELFEAFLWAAPRFQEQGARFRDGAATAPAAQARPAAAGFGRAAASVPGFGLPAPAMAQAPAAALAFA